jgi:hypothetical protein
MLLVGGHLNYFKEIVRVVYLV